MFEVVEKGLFLIINKNVLEKHLRHYTKKKLFNKSVLTVLKSVLKDVSFAFAVK